VGEHADEVTTNPNIAAARHRPREEPTSTADAAGSAHGDDSVADAAFKVRSLADTLQVATQSITAVVERLAAAAERHAEAADRLAATVPSLHHQHHQRLLEQQQSAMRGHFALQQQMFRQQHWLHQHQSYWQRLCYVQHHHRQQHRLLHPWYW
jgi:hypothetical protein